MRWILVLLSPYIWQGTPLFAAEVDEGQQLFSQLCSRCHKLPQSTTRTARQWEITVELMQAIMAKKSIAVLSVEQKQKVLRYLQQNASKVSQDDSSESQDRFVARCSLCHQLPEPTMLKPMQWKLIIQTMQQRMQQAGVPQLNENERQQILQYLQSQSTQ